jgi:choloylglycine hydrolase
MAHLRLWGFVSLAGLLLALVSLSQACTGVQVKTADGAVITGRTLEFGTEMESEIIIIPRGKTYVGTAPGGKAGLKWTTKYGTVGMNELKMPQVLDGVNEKGLGAGQFYFPGFAEYQPVPEGSASKALAPWELGTYLLTTCADVDEAVRAAKAILVGPTEFGPWKAVPGAHYRLQDASGKGAVLEFVDGKLKVHDNPLGVITNAPTFDWHLTNLRNYINLSPMSVRPVDVGGMKLAPLGQGTGMLGMPGDFTPPSRFVRAVALNQSADPVATAADGVKLAFHLLNNFDIPKGAARDKSDGLVTGDFTQWTTVTDFTNRRFYFRTYDNSRIRMIDLKKCDFEASDFKYISIGAKEEFEDLTAKAK